MNTLLNKKREITLINKMNKIIFLLIATSVVFANAKEDIEFIAKFQQIDSTSFGRYVLDMI